VGAVMIVGGNIAGVTRVMTTTIALETSKGDLALALALGIVLLGVVGIVNGAMGLVHHVGSQVRRAAPADVGAEPMPAPIQDAQTSAEPGPLLIVENATVRLGAVTALRDVSFTLQRGDRLILVGANGSGKTTLLKLLDGLVPYEGRCDYLPLRPEGRLPRIAMVFQQTFLLNLSVQRNMWIGLWLAGIPAAERAERCRQALMRVGLLGHLARPARTLSGGQQQRLGLARAWSQQPDLLLLDEPTASLDPNAKQEIENLIEAIGASGVSIVASTHNLGQAKRLATRVAYLQAGTLVVERPVEAFFDGDPLPQQADQFLKGELGWR
jgi:tungstate transport system ATP-binding protein